MRLFGRTPSLEFENFFRLWFMEISPPILVLIPTTNASTLTIWAMASEDRLDLAEVLLVYGHVD